MLLSPQVIWNAVSIALGVIGGTLFLWAMFRDRPRGRLRCPKCWYDMKGVVDASPAPPWTCPECGRVIRATKRLKRTRRRKRIAAIAALIVCLSVYAPLARDRVIARGWIGAIPTTALVLFAPVDDNSWDIQSFDLFGGTPRTFLGGPRPDASILLPELIRRFDEHDAWLPHWRIYLSRVIAAVPHVRTELCKTRSSWPRGVEVHARGGLPRIVGGRENDFRLHATRRGGTRAVFDADQPERYWYHDALGIMNDPIDIEVEIQLATRQLLAPEEEGSYPLGPDPASYRTVWRGVIRTVTVDERAASEIMRPVEDPCDGSEIALYLYPALLIRKDGTVNLGLGHIDSHVGGPNDCALGLRFEVLRSGEVVATGEHFYFNDEPGMSAHVYHMDRWEECKLAWTIAAPTSEADFNAAHWTLRAIGDPAVSLRDFDRDRYWPGTITMPLTQFERSEDEDWGDEDSDDE